MDGWRFSNLCSGLGIVFKVEKGNVIQVRGLNGTFQPLETDNWAVVMNGDVEVYKDQAFQSKFIKVDYTPPTPPTTTPDSENEAPPTVSSDSE